MDGQRPRHALRPGVEGLESILSLSTTGHPARPNLLAPAARRGLGTPSGADATTPTLTAEKSLAADSRTLQVHLTTDRRVYRAGQPIRVTMTETATGDCPVRVWKTPPYFLRAYEPGATLWSSQGPLENAANWVYLEPGKSRATTFVWNPSRQAGLPAPSGLVTIEGTIDTVPSDSASIRILGGRH